MSLLNVQNFHVYYGSIEAVKGINFDIKAGEIVSLIGCNGAGKSSTLRGLSGVARTSGSAQLKGIELLNLPSHERVAHGLVHCPEGRGLFPLMSVRENLEIGTFFRKDKRQYYKKY